MKTELYLQLTVEQTIWTQRHNVQLKIYGHLFQKLKKKMVPIQTIDCDYKYEQFLFVSLSLPLSLSLLLKLKIRQQNAYKTQ